MSTPHQTAVARLLADVAAGAVSPEAALSALSDLPAQDLGFARLDHQRPLRCGVPEVVFGQGKTAEQLVPIVAQLQGRGHPVLVTRLPLEVHAACGEALDALAGPGDWDPLSRSWIWNDGPVAISGEGTLVVACAGTADLPVAEEAARTAEALGNRVVRLVDVGVAGLHRMLAHLDTLRSARALVVVAGMEGALPSVVAGLVACPVFAVPTSVGYGSGLAGLAPLLAMLNSCAPGVSVVNIDNGFGAACVASLVNHPVLSDAPRDAAAHSSASAAHSAQPGATHSAKEGDR
ncbi:MAG: nickel pincer cofactor biosynthesis protein LarB [Planctomycetota bacterium]|nr:MAG: nickel pincer cofactor biosynthesis protein LarB [Planctomycetota bacterium]